MRRLTVSSSVPFFLFTRSQKSFSTDFQTLAMAKSLEESCGIYCYVSSLPGFKATLKHRYSDFIVNEVDLDGSIVRLTSFDLPPDCAEEDGENSSSLGHKSFTYEIELFKTLAGEANAEILKEFLQKVAANVDDEFPPIVLAPDCDKLRRTEVHNFFKKNFKFLVTDTVDGDDVHSKCIRIRFSSGRCINYKRGKKRKDMGNSGRINCIPFDSRGADNWPEERGKFLRFHLYKENKDTHEALGVLGKMLGIQQRSFGFAGTKDKRAVTTQRVTVFKLHPKRLAALNCRLFGIKIGDFRFVKNGLLLGQLQGNRFTITLRDVVADLEDTVKAAADGLGRSGFINYYGLQRFGSGSVPTHQIGAALLRGEWKTAVDLILDPKDGERSDIKEAREKYKQTGDVDLMLRQLPHHLVAERAIIHCLKKCPGNYLQALQSIPRTLRLMYVHSYQSYLWNYAASMRVQKHGIAQVVLGDLVFCKVESSEKIASFETVEPICEDDRGEGNDISDISDARLPEEKIQFVKTINSDDLVSGGYTFEDVVLPIPGSRTIYPGNDIAGIYHDISKKDGISLTESAHSVKEFSITNMTGDYRRVFQRPIDYTWELLTYKDNNESLAKTDLDALSGPKITDLVTNKNSNNTNSDGKINYPQTTENDESDSFVSDNQNGKIEQMECNYTVPKVALKLGFALPASCYATMAIRELLKSSNLVTYQKSLNY